jgi:hypothetical protein
MNNDNDTQCQESVIDQLKEYRAKHRAKYEQSSKLKLIEEKYEKLIVLDPIVLATCRLQNYMKKKILKETINKNYIPGVYKLRLDIRENNFKSNLKSKITDDTSYILYTIAIDLRIYGHNPTISFEVKEYGHVIYFSEKQIEKIKETWCRINPDTYSGLRFSQMISCSKALCEYYKKILDK